MHMIDIYTFGVHLHGSTWRAEWMSKMRTNKGRVQVYRTPTSIEQAKRTECREARAAFSSHPSKFLGHTHYRVSISSVAFINLNGQSFFSFLLCFKIFLISQSSSLHNCLCSHYPPFSLSSFFFFFSFWHFLTRCDSLLLLHMDDGLWFS